MVYPKVFIFSLSQLKCHCLYFASDRLKLRRVKEPTPYYRGGKWFSEVYKPTDTSEPPCPMVMHDPFHIKSLLYSLQTA